MAEENPKFPRDGYRPEWLALEDASGGRYIMSGDLSVDAPTFDAVFAAMSKQWPPLEEELEVWDETTEPLSGANNRALQVRIYKPKASSAAELPLTVFFHGGGYVAGNLDTEDAHCRYFAAKTPSLLISVNYPKVIQEGVNVDTIIACGVAAVSWSKTRASQLLDRPVDAIPTILNGGSAGAFMALQVTHHYVTQLNDTKSIDGIILLFPAGLPYDYTEMPDSQAPAKYKSRCTAWVENGYASVPIFGRDIAARIWDLYEADFRSPSHFPILSSNEVLAKFPPMYIVSAEKDCFRDDGKLLDWRVREELGGKSKLDYYEGLPHWFHTFPMLEVAREMMEKTVVGIKWVLSEATKKKSVSHT